MDARRIALAALIVAIIVVQFSSAPHQGASSTCVNDHCFTAASTSIIGLIGGAAMILVIALYPRRSPSDPNEETSGIRRRLAAFFIDFYVLLVGLIPALTLPLLLQEANVTGEFNWRFARDFSRPSDAALIMPSVLAAFVLLYLYFVLHARASTPTVGQFLMALRLRPDDETKTPNYWVYFLAVGATSGLWPIWIVLALTRGDKKFWWNVAFGTRVSKIA